MNTDFRVDWLNLDLCSFFRNRLSLQCAHYSYENSSSRCYMLMVGVGKYCITRVSKRHRLYKRVLLLLSILSSFYSEAWWASLIDGRRGQAEWNFSIFRRIQWTNYRIVILSHEFVPYPRKQESKDQVMFDYSINLLCCLIEFIELQFQCVYFIKKEII